MVPTTVGGYLQSLPNERRVAMARVCSMIRRSARGVRESMRFGLAFYELDGQPIFAVESADDALRLYVVEQDVVFQLKDTYKNINPMRYCAEFFDLNCMPLDVVEKMVRLSMAMRRANKEVPVPSQQDLVRMWGIHEEDFTAAPPIVRIAVNRNDPIAAVDPAAPAPEGEAPDDATSVTTKA